MLEKKNSVVMAEERVNHKEIWLMFFGQLMSGPSVNCESADCIAQITSENRNESFSGDRAVVSDNDRRLSRGERSGEGPHKS